MAGEKKVADLVVREIGTRLSRLAARKASSRIVGQVTARSPRWRQAFDHIRPHFLPDPAKPRHSVFARRYRTEDAVAELIRRVASRPSRAPVTTKLTIAGHPAGKPAVVLEHWFPNPIGDEKGHACHILRIVADYTGQLITAFPTRQFLGAAAGVAVVASGAADATAAGPIAAVSAAYATEREAQAQRADAACTPDGVIEWLVDFLIAPSCIAPEPHQLISPAELEQRITRAITGIVAQTGPLDHATRQSIRADIIDIWGMGYRMR